MQSIGSKLPSALRTRPNIWPSGSMMALPCGMSASIQPADHRQQPLVALVVGQRKGGVASRMAVNFNDRQAFRGGAVQHRRNIVRAAR